MILSARRSLALLALLLTPAGVDAQEPARRDSVPLVHAPAIVVTANRGPTSAAYVASSITVVTRDEIERRQHRTVLDALRDVVGVAIVRNGGPGGVTSAFLRGAANDHVLVLIDGVEVNDPAAPTRAYDFADLPAADVERIEVLRGPQSTIYGSGAMGGVIQIFTRRGAGPPRVSLVGEGGSFASAHLALSAAGSGERIGYAVTIVERRTDGISAAPARLGNREADGHRVRSASGRLDWRAAPWAGLGMTVRASGAAADVDRGTPTGDDPNFVSEGGEASMRVWTELGLPESRWRHAVALGVARRDRETRDDPDAANPEDRSRGTYEGRRWTLEWLHEADLAGTLTSGVETQSETASGSFESESAFGPFASELPGTSSRTTGVFAQHRSTIGPLAAAIGARADHHSRFGTAATFRLAPVLSLGATRFKATYGTGFKAPTLFQLFDPEFGNDELEAETSRGWDAGLERELAGGRVRVDGTLFATEFENLVGFEFPAGYRNVRAASTRGVEALVSWLALEELRLWASYTRTRTEDESEGPGRGKRLIRRPAHQGSVGIEWAVPRRADAAIELRLVGEREDEDFETFPAQRVTLEGYALLRLAGSYAMTENLRLFGRIENALDAVYEEVLGYGTPGRSLYGGLTATF